MARFRHDAGEKVIEHYHISMLTEDGMREGTIRKDGKWWIVDDNWGDITGIERRDCLRTNQLSEAISFIKGNLERLYPTGQWMHGAGFPKEWNKQFRDKVK
jgi:hypothetical protein